MMESCNSIIIWACNFGKIVMRPAQNAWNHRDKTIVALLYMPIEGAVLTFRFLCFIPIHRKPHVPSLSASFSSPSFISCFSASFTASFATSSHTPAIPQMGRQVAQLEERRTLEAEIRESKPVLGPLALVSNFT